MASLLSAVAPPPAPTLGFFESTELFFELGEDGVSRFRELNNEQLQELEEVDKTLEESREFRVGATSTLARLDLHLNEYRRAMILRFRLENKVDELLSQDSRTPDNDQLFFPNNLEQMYDNIRWYLTIICPKLRPRKKEGVVKLPTLVSRRWSMLHWLKMYLDWSPNYKQLQAKTNQALYYAAKKYGVQPSQYNKPYFGRHELQYLMDKDMETTLNVEVAESHHLAWLLGCIGGLRPGAIGNNKHRPQAYLRWEHIKITRDENDKHKFILKLTLPYMKGFQDLNKLEQGGDGSLELTIMPPENPDNILICPTYRLLIIALRRGLLSSYATPIELLNDNRINITIKEEHRQDPVFYAVKQRGLELDTSSPRPASSASFTTYLSKRASDHGFREGVTMYSFRRAAGTKVDRTMGRAAARRFLHHNPQSFTFEQSYENPTFDLDVGRIMYDEDHVAGSTEMVEKSHPVLYRAHLHLTPTEQRRQIEQAVEQWVRKDAPNKALEVRRCRRYAMKALRRVAADISDGALTIEDVQKRRDELKSISNLTKAMYEHAKASLEERRQLEAADATAAQQEEELDDEEEDDDDDQVDYRDLGDMDVVVAGLDEEGAEEAEVQDVQLHEAEHLPRPGSEGSPILDNLLDVQDWVNGVVVNGTLFESLPSTVQTAWLEKLRSYLQETTHWKTISPAAANFHTKIPSWVDTLQQKCSFRQLQIETDLPADQEKIATVSYELATAALFDLMLEKQVMPGAKVQCTECLADDTVSGQDKFKLYKSASDLKRHVQSNAHSPWKRWIRKATMAKDQHPQKKFACIPACGRTYNTLNKFQDHMTKAANKIVDNRDTDDIHYATAQEEGWLSPMFNKSRRDPDQYQQITAARQKERITRYGHLPRLTELSSGRPAVINGTPSQCVSVGPAQQDLSVLQYPVALQGNHNDAMRVHQECVQKGLLGNFADFGETDQSSLASIMRKSGMSDDEIFGDKDKLPKF